MNKNLLGLAAVILSVIAWGISFVSTKIVLVEISPVSIAFFRQFIALVPLVILMGLRKESFRLKKGEIWAFLFATFFGIVLYFVFENHGLAYTSASNASMLVAAIPVFALITESITKKTRLDLASFLCIVASILGVYFVISENGVIDFSSKTFLGNALILGAMASWIVYTFISKKLGESYSSLKMTSIQTFLSIPLFIPFVFSEISTWHVPSSNGIYNLIFLGIFCSAMAYVCFLFGIQTLGPVLPSAFLNLIPVVTIIAGIFLLAEKLSVYQIAGAALIVGSLSYLSFIRIRPLRKKQEDIESAA